MKYLFVHTKLHTQPRRSRQRVEESKPSSWLVKSEVIRYKRATICKGNGISYS